jgi:hypothetical protein
MLIVVPETHLDHALSAGHIRFIFDLFKDRNSFFLETVELPASLPPLPCSLRGPAVGLPPVPDAEVVMKARNGRAWPSRMMLGSWAPLDVHTMTVIAGPGAGHLCVLYTAYGGPAAPREPGDPSLQGAELVASEAFWAKHALVG